jgi:lysosomal acid lipase/cholesteryl ester hydrolase
MMHGLFQSGGVYVTSGADSLAFCLANEGYDVWLGNNRCVEKKHAFLKENEEKFWDWSMDELARYDFPALIDFVLKSTDQAQIIYIGHSQGTSQAFLGLSFNPDISSKLKCLVTLAPAMYVGTLLRFVSTGTPNHSQPPLSTLIQAGDATFLSLFGTKEFVPIMNTVKHFAPSSVFADVAYRMFNFLFNWTDKEWNKAYKTAYFHTTPRPTSTKGLLHWFQIARYGNVLRPFRPASPAVSRADSGIVPEVTSTSTIELEDASFDLSCIRCPLAVAYGGMDKIVDTKRMLKECGLNDGVNLVMSECVEGYEHMDVIWGKHAKELVFDKLIKVLREL